MFITSEATTTTTKQSASVGFKTKCLQTAHTDIKGRCCYPLDVYASMVIMMMTMMTMMMTMVGVPLACVCSLPHQRGPPTSYWV